MQEGLTSTMSFCLLITTPPVSQIDGIIERGLSGPSIGLIKFKSFTCTGRVLCADNQTHNREVLPLR